MDEQVIISPQNLEIARLEQLLRHRNDDLADARARIAALEAVAEAAREHAPYLTDGKTAWRLMRAVKDLDATPETGGEDKDGQDVICTCPAEVEPHTHAIR